MNNKIKTPLLILFFVFSFFSINSQTIKTEKKPLAIILNAIEERFNISFSYADKAIEGYEITVPSNTLNLNKTITYLETQTGLDFKILSSRFIAIVTPNDTKKIVEELDEILLTTILTSGITKDKNGATIIKPNKFGILPGLIEPDILQTIQALPGVLSVDETVSNLNVRGGTHDQNLILWDGIKMYQSGHFFGLISAFNPYLTKSVLVSKNGTSALYGDGVSSTIDMRLDNTINKKNSSGFGIDLIQADGFAKLKLKDNLELQISGRRSITDVVQTPTYNSYFDRIFQDSDVDGSKSENNSSFTSNEDFHFYDVSAKVLYDLSDKDKIRINFTSIYNTLDYLEQSKTTTNALNNNLNQRNLASGISYNRKWDNVLSNSLFVHYSNYRLNANNYNVENNQRHTQKNEVQDNGITFKTLIDFNQRFNWVIGYQFTEVGITNLEDINMPKFRSNLKRVVSTHSTFSEITYSSKNKNTHLKAGVRSNYYNPLNVLILEPRLSFNQQFWNHFKIEFLGEFKSQATSQVIDRQNDFLGIEKRRWVLANNTTIPIIESNQASIGVHFNKNKLLISAEAYIKHVDGITTRSQGFQNQYQFINAIGSYEVKGIDFLINKQFTNVSAWLSYSLSENNYIFETLNESASFPNNSDITHSATFAGTYSVNSLKFALGINWRSGKPSTEPEKNTPVFDNNINYNSPNNTDLEDYFRTDFSSTYDFKISKTAKGKVGLSVWNVLNKRNKLNTYYILTDNNTISKIENKSLGLTPNLSFMVNF